MRSLVLLLACSAAAAGAQRADTAATKRELLEADRAVARVGVIAFLGALEADAAVEFPGVNLLRGATEVRPALEARYGGANQYTWAPAHAIASSDGTFGCTTGFTTYVSASDTAHARRGGTYATCWRRARDGGWRIAGHQRNENSVGAVVVEPGTMYDVGPHSATEASGAQALREAQDADAAFAAMGALAAGPGPAFVAYAAADAMFPGRVPNALGPDMISAGFKDFPAARVLRWTPTRAVGAAAGGLAFTIGDATTELRADAQVLGKSHYFTVWRREPDGRWRWILDLGSPRP
jgi:ketosteroid isomerase-like protein